MIKITAVITCLLICSAGAGAIDLNSYNLVDLTHNYNKDTIYRLGLIRKPYIKVKHLPVFITPHIPFVLRNTAVPTLMHQFTFLSLP